MHRSFGLLLLLAASCKLPELEKPDRLIDLDDDGFTEVENDCAPEDPDIHPGAEDVCDGFDNDCSDTPDDQFNVTGGDPFWVDADGDGWGDPAQAVTACFRHDGYASQAGDCNDADGAVHPELADPCNDVDDDCDGVKDENGENIHWLDEDDDGFGNPAIPWCGSGTPPTTHVTNPDDCDDGNNLIYLGAPERCDEKDNDCDEDIDEDAIDAITLCLDADDDGLGDPDQTLTVCVNPGGDWEFDCTDCDDGDNTVAATRTWYADTDSDTWGDSANIEEVCDAPTSPPAWVLRGGDCAVGEPAINPGELETCRNGVDDDCDETSDCRFPEGFRLTGGTESAGLRVEGTTALDRIGSSLYTADLDQDGYSDVGVVVANLAASSEIAVVQSGPGQGGGGVVELDDIRKTTFAPTDGKGSAAFGDAAVALGDLDDDAFREVVVGDPGANDVTLGNPSGSAYVFWSNTGILTPTESGDTGTPWPQWLAELRIDGAAAGDDFGTRIVRTAGYRTDPQAFAVSAPGNAQDDGAVYLVRISDFAHTGGVNASAGADNSVFIDKYTGPLDEGTRFGAGLAFFHGPGDNLSLAVGATLTPDLGSGDPLDGALYIFRLPTDDATVPTNAGSAAVKIFGFTGAFGAFGSNVINVGDVNGDGAEDIAVAAPTYEYEGVLHRGKVYLLSGAIPDGTTTRIENMSSTHFIGGFIGPETDAGLGVSLAAGDVDADGFDDLLFAAPLLDTAAADSGATWLVYGRAEPYGVVELGTGNLAGGTRFYSTLANDHLGQGLTCGDVDGDGYDDVLIGSPQFDPGALRQNAGAVYLLYGNGP